MKTIYWCNEYTEYWLENYSQNNFWYFYKGNIRDKNNQFENVFKSEISAKRYLTKKLGKKLSYTKIITGDELCF